MRCDGVFKWNRRWPGRHIFCWLERYWWMQDADCPSPLACNHLQKLTRSPQNVKRYVMFPIRLVLDWTTIHKPTEKSNAALLLNCLLSSTPSSPFRYQSSLSSLQRTRSALLRWYPQPHGSSQDPSHSHKTHWRHWSWAGMWLTTSLSSYWADPGVVRLAKGSSFCELYGTVKRLRLSLMSAIPTLSVSK